MNTHMQAKRSPSIHIIDILTGKKKHLKFFGSSYEPIVFKISGTRSRFEKSAVSVDECLSIFTVHQIRKRHNTI